ncbi:hypothetical protein Ciccas_004609 [Cichlidogyrus casuarinus]|uniref:Uncharacterized protein n=1 Tax=Cichlidogyrus casuarinus TaxID=1844966 RepID=A0ABD2QB16_9PLAT
MNGDISRIPIQTLGAVISLTDTLEDLPLPSATNNSLHQETLLQNPTTFLDDAYFLPFHEPGVKASVLDALSQTDTNNIDFLDNYVPPMNDLNSLPNELKSLIEENRALFSSKVGFADMLGFPHDAGESKNISDSCDSHGKRKKKKKKKKKRKHREAGGDTSETDSNPASVTGNNGNGESHIRYIKMDQSEKKISLKISLKKPVVEEDVERKERKKKKHKNRSKYADEESEKKPNLSVPPSQEYLPNTADLPSSSFLNNNNNNHGQSFDQYLDPTDLQIMDDYFKKELAQYPNTQSNNTSYMLSDILNQSTPDLDLSAISDVPAAPTGLAGYLASTPIPRPSKGKPDFIGSHGPPPPSRRSKSIVATDWLFLYPEGQSTEIAGGKSTWERALGSYSQALGEKAKRRKRMSRHPQTSGGMNSSYVFEGDEEYPNDHNDSDYEPDSEPEKELTNGRSELPNGKVATGRSSSRLKSYVGMAADEEDDGEDVKRRGRADEDTPFEIRLKDSVEQRFPHLMQKSADRTKRRERVGFRASMGLSHQKHQHLDDESAAENSIETSLARFSARLDTLFESIEEMDLLKCLGSGASFKLPPEAAISLTDLAELCRHAAKLKATKVTNRLNTDKLVKLLTLLLLNLRDGEGVVPTLEGGDQEDEQSCRLWRELAMERVMRSVQSSLVGLHLMTSVDMPREVYLEDFIQSSVQVVRFQFFNCIYPEYDPAYRTDNSGKGTSLLFSSLFLNTYCIIGQINIER